MMNRVETNMYFDDVHVRIFLTIRSLNVNDSSFKQAAV